MRISKRVILIATASWTFSTVVMAADAPGPVAASYATGSTEIGMLLDNPETKAVLDKYIPGLTNDPQIAMARSMTLKDVQAFAGGQITDGQLAKIDADLAKLAVNK